uniref:Terminase n=1 Tax=viral metagenome TaxID=1070528 RepID=A0A6M3JTF1_9ZZZZ
MPFNQTTADNILARIANGDSLDKICKEPDFPSKQTIFKWRRENEEFGNDYARAREDQADTYADKILDIIDNEPDSNRARVKVDAVKWIASKLKPKIYSDYARRDIDLTLPRKIVVCYEEAVKDEG